MIDDMHWEATMRAMAVTQLGLVARLHLPGLGLTKQHWHEARCNGRWQPLSARVLLLDGVARTDDVRALAAVLDASPGAALHWRSTLAWFGLRGFDLRTIQVARPRELRETATTLGELHLLRSLRDHHVIVVRGMPTQTPLRAIWSEAARYASPGRVDLGIRRVGRLLDDAHKANLVTWSALNAMVEDIQQRGRAGTVLMRALAADRPVGSSPSESGNEDRFEWILDRRNVGRLRRQVDVGGIDVIGRTDYRDPRRPLVVEVNSMVHHTTPSDRAADVVRYQRLNDADFFVAVVWDIDLWRRPDHVVDVVIEARRRTDAGGRSVLHTAGCPWPPEYLVQPESA